MGYGRRDSEIRSAGAGIVAISVDPPEKSRVVKASWRLPFPVLCDVDQSVITEWGLLNTKEKGGIAFPAVYIIGTDRRVEAQSADTTMSRVNPNSVIEFLRGKTQQLKSNMVLPHVGTMFKSLVGRG
jgi:peroxiredoxin